MSPPPSQEKCLRLLGAFIEAEAFVSVMKSNVRAASASAASKKAWLAVLATLIQGSSAPHMLPLLASVCDELTEMEASLPEQPDHQVGVWGFGVWVCVGVWDRRLGDGV